MLKLDLKKLNIIIDEKLKNEIIPSLIQLSHNDKERGGILIGEIYPDSNTIAIIEIYESMKAKASKYSIEIDNVEMQFIIDKVHQNSSGLRNYLGDWHTHPEPIPHPSSIDNRTFKDRVRKSKLNKNFLLNMIIGNDITQNYIRIDIIEKEFNLINFYMNIIKNKIKKS